MKYLTINVSSATTTVVNVNVNSLQQSKKFIDSYALSGVEIHERIGGGNFGDGNYLNKLPVTTKVFRATWNFAPVAAKKLKDANQKAEFQKELELLR